MASEEPRSNSAGGTDRLVRFSGVRQHDLRDVDVDIPREALVVFSGISGSGQSSLAFSTIYAEAERRYFTSATRRVAGRGLP